MWIPLILFTIFWCFVNARPTNEWKSNRFSPHEISMIQRNESLPKLNIGLIVPYTNFGAREYTKAINKAVANLHKASRGLRKYTFLEHYQFTQHQIRNVMMELTPSPTGNNVDPDYH